MPNPIDANQRFKSGAESIIFVSGVVALVADAVVLGALTTGLLTSNIILDAVGLATVLLTAILLFIYGWAVLAWTLTRKAVNFEIAKQRSIDLVGLSEFASFVVSILLLPLAIIWHISFMLTLFPEMNEITLVLGCLGLILAGIGYHFLGAGISFCIAYLMPRFYDDLAGANRW